MAAEWLKSAVAKLVYGKRASIVPKSLNATWPQRMFLKRLLDDLNIDCVLDVGANGGQYGSELRRIGFQGLIISFEPDPACFSRLEAKSAADARWHTVNLALGRTPGTADFNLMEVSLFNSFRMPTTSETSQFAGANAVARTLSVEVATLAQLLPALRAKHGFQRTFLKMDTQGFDAEVFAGAAEVHAEILAFQSELAIKRLYQDVPIWTDQIATYSAAGFELAGLFAVNPDEAPLIELDCYFRQASAR